MITYIILFYKEKSIDIYFIFYLLIIFYIKKNINLFIILFLLLIFINLIQNIIKN